MDVNKALKSVMATGKVLIGYRQAKKAAKNKQAKMVVVAGNCPAKAVEDLRALKVPVLSYTGTNVDLGTACGKPFAIATLVILEPGESNILSAATGE